MKTIKILSGRSFINWCYRTWPELKDVHGSVLGKAVRHRILSENAEILPSVVEDGKAFVVLGFNNDDDFVNFSLRYC